MPDGPIPPAPDTGGEAGGWGGGPCRGAEEAAEKPDKPRAKKVKRMQRARFHKNRFCASSLTQAHFSSFAFPRRPLSSLFFHPGTQLPLLPSSTRGSAPPCSAGQLRGAPAAGRGGGRRGSPPSRTPEHRGHTLGARPFSSFGFPFSSKYFPFPLAGPSSFSYVVHFGSERWVANQDGDLAARSFPRPLCAQMRAPRRRGGGGLAPRSLRVRAAPPLRCPGTRPPCARSAPRIRAGSTALAGVRTAAARAADRHAERPRRATGPGRRGAPSAPSAPPSMRADARLLPAETRFRPGLMRTHLSHTFFFFFFLNL